MRAFMMMLTLTFSVSLFGQSIKPTPKDITLTHRVLNGCEDDACYFDMYHMEQRYGYGLSLEFGNDHGDNLLGTVQVADEFGKIVDLGAISCKEIKSSYPEQRTKNPWLFLIYSGAWDKLQSEGRDQVAAQKNHCYLMYKTGSDKQIVVAFHVKDLVKNSVIILDEIEVFKRSEITR